MIKRFYAIAAAAFILGGCGTPPPPPPPPPPCLCPTPCPHLINNPNGVCPCNSPLCQCRPTHAPTVNEYVSVPTAKVAHANYKEVILDGFQPGLVAVQDIRRSKTNDGYQRVQVLVKNLTTSSMRVRYRFDWQDANGVIQEDPDNMGWEKLELLPGDNGTFTSIAPKKNCADFRLRMKHIQ